MAYGCVIKLDPSIVSTADIPGPILIDNRAYVPDSYIEEDKRKIWYTQVLIAYSISGTTCTFMGLFPMHIRKPQVLE